MLSFFDDFFQDVFFQLATFMIATLPVGGLRLAIPLALNNFKLSLEQAFLFSVVGSMLPVFLIIYYLKPFHSFLSKRFNACHRFFDWLFGKTRYRFNHHYDRYGMAILVALVVVPFPMADAWTAAIIAWLFELPKTKSLIYIFIGTLVSGVIVSLLSIGAINYFS